VDTTKGKYAGYGEAAAFVAKENGKSVTLLDPVYSGDFSASDKGLEFAKAMIDQGADVFFGDASAVDSGARQAIDAANEAAGEIKIYDIAQPADLLGQNACIIGSQVTDNSALIELSMKAVEAGTFGGETPLRTGFGLGLFIFFAAKEQAEDAFGCIPDGLAVCAEPVSENLSHGLIEFLQSIFLKLCLVIILTFPPGVVFFLEFIIGIIKMHFPVTAKQYVTALFLEFSEFIADILRNIHVIVLDQAFGFFMLFFEPGDLVVIQRVKVCNVILIQVHISGIDTAKNQRQSFRFLRLLVQNLLNSFIA
jgi:hypothetical protein